MTRLSRLIEQIRQDLGYACRSLAANPGFAATAILTIALGVGMNTGIFSLLNAVAFRGLPVADPFEFVAINQDVRGVPRGRNNSAQFATAEFEVYRDRTETLSGILAYGRMWMATLGREAPQQVVASPVSCNYFDLLRRPPEIGAGLISEHCASSADAGVAVIAHDLWVSRFGRDPSILERTVVINGNELQIVGVAPEGFHGIDIDRPVVFVPLTAQRILQPDRDYLENDTVAWLNLVGRRRPGISTEQVQTELSVIGRQFDLAQPGRRTSVSVSRATPLSAPDMRTAVLGASAVIMLAFGLVLLVACANVANLMLARADMRVRETAIRLSLGATRARLIRQLMTESTVIALVGGMLGAILAVGTFDIILSVVLDALPPEARGRIRIEPAPDLRVFAFAVSLSALAGLGFGLTPALTATRPDLRTAIAQDSATAGRRSRGRLQATLVGAQVAFCMILVITTALLLRALYTAQSVDPAFDHDRLVVASAEWRGFGYDAEDAASVQDQAIEHIRALPGVEDVAQAFATPLETRGRRISFRRPDEEDGRQIFINNVSANYFSVSGIPLLRGRTFSVDELAAAQVSAAILSDSTASALWPNRDALGQTLVYEGFGDPRPIEVIGIVRDVEVRAIGESATSYIYLPAIPGAQPDMQLVVRSALPADQLRPGIQGVFAVLAPELPVTVRPVSDNFEFWTALSRLAASLSFGLGSLALVLASVGVFGVMSTVVSRRVREIGVRLALGAGKADVLGLMVARSMRPVVVGAAVGALACFGIARLLSGLLFGVGALDPLALTGAAVTMLAAAVLASAVPALRAMNVDPIVTLRYE